MNKQELLQFIKDNGSNFRSDCPVCGNKNTFIASTEAGQLSYYCFHVACNTKGKTDDAFSIWNVGSDNGGFDRWHGLAPVLLRSVFTIPDYWVSPLQNTKCYEFLKYWNLLNIYAEGRISIYYDPKQERCVFLIKDHKGELKGATGRGLISNNLPRWFIYSRIDSALGLVPSRSPTKKILLVEDFISACTGSSCIHSAALLGTSLPMESISSLLSYDLAYIALDKDATKKSLIIQKELSPYINSRIISLDRDIKYYKETDLKKLKEFIENDH